MKLEDWTDEIKSISNGVERALEVHRALGQWLWENVVAHDVWPREMPDTVQSMLNNLRKELENVRQTSDGLFENLSSMPTFKYLSGRPLSKQEYYLLAARGIEWATAKKLGLSPVSDYKVSNFRL